MEEEIRDVAESNLDDIPGICRFCLYWSFPEEFEKSKTKPSKHKQHLEAEKKRWIVQTLNEFGVCGKIHY